MYNVKDLSVIHLEFKYPNDSKGAKLHLKNLLNINL